MASRQRPRWGTGPTPTHRDVAALTWVADQYAVRADLLGLLLGRLSPELPRMVHAWEYASGQRAQLPALSEATVRYHLRRWHKAGWVSVQRALGRTWIAPTPTGLTLAGSDYRPWSLVPSRLAHVHAVGLVRLAIETANPQAEWVSERELARMRAQARASWWLLDGGLVVADASVSGGPPLHTIEVELTPKHLAKLQQVFEARYPGEVQTTYFTPPTHPPRRPAPPPQRAGAGHPAHNEPWSRVTVVPLPELPANAKRWSPRSTPPGRSPERPAATASPMTQDARRRWGWPTRAATCTHGSASVAG